MNGVSIVRFAFEWQLYAIKKLTKTPNYDVPRFLCPSKDNSLHVQYCLHMFILFTHVYTVHQNNIGRHIISLWIIE